MKAGKQVWDWKSPLKLMPPSNARWKTRGHMYFCANILMSVAYLQGDFHIVSFMSFGRTLSLFSQSCMLHETNGTG